MANKFKIGDRVYCVDNYDIHAELKNKIYTVKKTDIAFVLLEEYSKDYYWANSRFILATKALEVLYG